MNIKKKGEELYEKTYDILRCYSAKQRRINEFKHKSAADALTPEQVEQVKAYYSPYKIPSMVFHRYFTEKTGIFCPEYIPQDLYVSVIDPYFNDIRGAKYLDNKCYFDALFHGIPQPHTVLKRTNGIWMDRQNRTVSREAARELLRQETVGLFVKEAQTSSGGHGVTFFGQPAQEAEQILNTAGTYETDVIIQRGLTQHPDLAKINASSVNTLRLYSILGRDGTVTIYSAVLRMGIGSAKVDNYSSGGISCGVAEDGTLRRYGYNKLGEKVEAHPTTGIVFEGYPVPNYAQAVETVKSAHPMIPHYRSVSWDIAITGDGTPVLIEANLCRGGIDLLQLNNGPLYGKDTKKILDEVFHK